MKALKMIFQSANGLGLVEALLALHVALFHPANPWFLGNNVEVE